MGPPRVRRGDRAVRAVRTHLAAGHRALQQVSPHASAATSKRLYRQPVSLRCEPLTNRTESQTHSEGTAQEALKRWPLSPWRLSRKDCLRENDKAVVTKANFSVGQNSASETDPNATTEARLACCLFTLICDRRSDANQVNNIQLCHPYLEHGLPT